MPYLAAIGTFATGLMSVINSFVLPSDYGCIALVNPKTYATFVSEYWQLEQLLDHFISEINQYHMVAWGCVQGNWKLEIHDQLADISGYQEISGTIYSSGTLLLANYDSLTYVAQFIDERLPVRDMENYRISVDPAKYRCRVIQLFNPQQAESEEVFYQESPHFIIEIIEDETTVEPWSKIPWFPISE